MKKEKTVRTYKRRTKSGKMITVHAYKASYNAVEEARKASTKKDGAGSELSKKKADVEENPLGFSADDYKAWYHWDMENDANNEAALRVEKALTKKMGKKAYNKYLEDMSNSYSARGHKKAHQSLLDEHTARQKKQDAEISKAAKDITRGAKEKATEVKASKSKSNGKTKSELIGNPNHPAWKEFDKTWSKTESEYIKKYGGNLTEKQQERLDRMYEKAEDNFIRDYGKSKNKKESFIPKSKAKVSGKTSSAKTEKAEPKTKKLTAKKSGKSSDVSVDDVKKAYSTPGGFTKLGLKRTSSEGMYEEYQHKSGKLFRVHKGSGKVQDITPTGKGKRLIK